MVDYLKTEYGDEVDLALNQFKSSEAYGHIAQTMDNLNASSGNSSGRLADAQLQLSEELSAFEATFDYVNVSDHFKEYIKEVNQRITSVTHNFMEEINEHSELIDG